MHTVQMHLSQKQKIFSEFFSSFFKSALNFEHFQKRGCFWLSISEITDHEKPA